jgi:hypothetical protein
MAQSSGTRSRVHSSSAARKASIASCSRAVPLSCSPSNRSASPRLFCALAQSSGNRCDQEHMPAYLESSNSANMPLYQRFGFEVLGVIRAGHSPPMVPDAAGRALTRFKAGNPDDQFIGSDTRL